MYERLKRNFTNMTSNPIDDTAAVYAHPFLRATADNLNGVAVASAFNWVINNKEGKVIEIASKDKVPKWMLGDQRLLSRYESTKPIISGHDTHYDVNSNRDMRIINR